MRSVSLAVASLLALAFGCSSNAKDSEGSIAAAATEEEMALAALAKLGAKVPGADGNCVQCHDVNKATLRLWAESYRTTMAFLRDETKSVDERINYMRRNPADPASGFAPAKLGFLTAGGHLGEAGIVNPTRHPVTHAQGKLLAALFAGRDAEYARFREETRMPIEADYDRLSAGDYEPIVAWVEKGMPKLDALVVEEPRPTTCTDDFTALAEHVRTERAKTWQAANRDARFPMFACEPGADPLTCFAQTSGSPAAPVFPDAKTTAYGTTWAADDSVVRVLRPLEYKTHFWMRNSSDGRFVANGGGPRINGAGAVIADLAAALDPAGPKTRDISAQALYDPDFSPRDDWFMFQGTSRSGSMCSMSLLRNPATTTVTFLEPECNKLDSVGLYQSVGQVLGDNSISDSFVVNSKFASDNPGLTATDRDLPMTAGPAAAVKIAVAVPRGNDADEGYQVRQKAELKTPFKGDTMMARSGKLIGSRVAGELGPLGYAIDKLSFTKGAEGYRFSIRQVGRICMPGNKANFSFDERFLVTHHYLTREDFASDAEFAPYKAKGAADLYLADFVTGKKTRITRMAPGQFAIFPHFRSDGWVYFLVRDNNLKKEFVAATDYAIRSGKTP